jgi:hypothetical protein
MLGVMSTDLIQAVREALTGVPGVHIAPDLPADRLRPVAEPHAIFLHPDEAVIAFIAPVGPAAASPVLLTDRMICWSTDGAVHRLHYADIRAGGLRTRDATLTVPPAQRLRHRPDSLYVVRMVSADAAGRLSRLLERLAGHPTPFPVPLGTVVMRGSILEREYRAPAPAPRSLEPASPAKGKGKGKGKGRGKTPPPPPPTALAVKGMIADRDPGLAAALADFCTRGEDYEARAALLLAAYGDGSDSSRDALAFALRRLRFGFGTWKGAKRIYKAAESKNDARFFGYLAYRIDADDDYSRYRTRRHMRRRVWRFLRGLARTSPANYPYYAAEALIHYTAADLSAQRTRFVWKTVDSGTAPKAAAQLLSAGARGANVRRHEVRTDLALTRWVLCNVLHRRTPGLTRNHYRFFEPKGSFPPPRMGTPAYAELWNADPGPLLHVVQLAEAEPIREWALNLLRTHHVERLRTLPPDGVYALLGSKHETAALFGWDLLTANLAPSAVSDEALLSALASPHAALSQRAAGFLATHRKAGDIPVGRWVTAAMADHQAAAEFAAKWLVAHHAAELGWPEFARLLKGAQPTARRIALEMLSHRPDLLTGEAASVSALAAALDTPLPDVRDGLCRLIDTAPLDAATAFGLLDLPYPDVQRAARALIERRFADFDAPEYLLQAAESPDDSVMRWAAEIIMRRLPDDPARLSRLLPFWRRLLLRVNTGGAVKRRLAGFLRETALRHPASALAAAVPGLLAGMARSASRGEFERGLSTALRLSASSPDVAAKLSAEWPGLEIDDGVVRSGTAG